MHHQPFLLKSERGVETELSIGIKPAQDSVLATSLCSEFLYHYRKVIMVIICTERFKMNLSHLRFEETPKKHVLSKISLGFNFHGATFNSGEFCDCAVGVNSIEIHLMIKK